MPDPNPDKPDAPGRRSSASRGGTRSSRAAGAADEPGPDEPGHGRRQPGRTRTRPGRSNSSGSAGRSNASSTDRTAPHPAPTAPGGQCSTERQHREDAPMPVRYIRVNPVADLFSPAIRAYGNIAVIGAVTPPAANPPADLVAVDSLSSSPTPPRPAAALPATWAGRSRCAFSQSPTPTVVTGSGSIRPIPTGNAACDAGGRDVQIVALANTALTAASGGRERRDPQARRPRRRGVQHRRRRHGTHRRRDAGQGRQRPDRRRGALASERMVYVAHKSD